MRIALRVRPWLRNHLPDEFVRCQDIIDRALRHLRTCCANPACGREEGGIGGVKALFDCSRCHLARYCSRECQVPHWKEHCSECSKFTKWTKRKAFQEEEQVFDEWCRALSDQRGFPERRLYLNDPDGTGRKRYEDSQRTGQMRKIDERIYRNSRIMLSRIATELAQGKK